MADVKEFGKEVRVSIGALIFASAALATATYQYFEINTLGDRSDKRYERHQEKIEEFDVLLEIYDERIDELEYKLKE